jgi:hypothetical protein
LIIAAVSAANAQVLPPGQALGSGLFLGSGRCASDLTCNNTDINEFFNHTAAINSPVDGKDYANWFSFDLPDELIVSATLRIWNYAGNSGGSGQYNIRQASSISFSDLVVGPVLGSISVSDANRLASRFININLNSDGLAALNAAAGGIFLFGGSIAGADSQSVIFDNTDGVLQAPQLRLVTSSVVPGPIAGAGLPALLALGGFVWARRRKTAAVA